MARGKNHSIYSHDRALFNHKWQRLKKGSVLSPIGMKYMSMSLDCDTLGDLHIVTYYDTAGIINHNMFRKQNILAYAYATRQIMLP